MVRLDMRQAARVLGIGRVVAGIGMFTKPDLAGRAFAGSAGATPAVSIFARGFAARDTALGVGMLASAATDGPVATWIAAALAADAADAAAVLLAFGKLPRRERWVGLLVSLVPALTEVAVLALTRCSSTPADDEPTVPEWEPDGSW